MTASVLKQDPDTSKVKDKRKPQQQQKRAIYYGKTVFCRNKWRFLFYLFVSRNTEISETKGNPKLASSVNIHKQNFSINFRLQNKTSDCESDFLQRK